MLKRWVRPILLWLFLLTEAILTVLIQLTDGWCERYLSYAVVILAFLCSLNFLSRDKARIMTSVGLAFTLVSDYYLVILNAHYDAAMTFFACVQAAYAVRLYFEASTPTYRRVQLGVRLGVTALALVLPLIVLGEGADYLSVISVAYFANLLLNTVFACVNIKKGWIFAVGLILFCFCDVFVGFSKLGGYIKIEPGTFAWWLAHPGFNACWLFYAPSQALIAVSNLKIDELKKSTRARDCASE